VEVERLCFGRRLEDNRQINVITIALGDESFDEDLERLKAKEFPVPRYSSFWTRNVQYCTVTSPPCHVYSALRSRPLAMPSNLETGDDDYTR
jgi:hypothetical protein